MRKQRVRAGLICADSKLINRVKQTYLHCVMRDVSLHKLLWSGLWRQGRYTFQVFEKHICSRRGSYSGLFVQPRELLPVALNEEVDSALVVVTTDTPEMSRIC